MKRLKRSSTSFLRSLTGAVVVPIDSTKLDPYYQNPEYAYENTVKKEADYSLLGDIAQTLRELFFYSDASPFFKYLFYAIVLATMAYVIYQFAKFSKLGFSKAKERKVSTALSLQDIKQIDLNQELAKAQEAQNWKRAIQLLFLLALQRCEKSKAINYQASKTNSDYVKEVATFSFASSFQSLSQNYERMAYGNFTGNQDLFEALKIELDQIPHQLHETSH